jgi:DNA-binding IclR family transcriptional regulator
MRTKGRAADTGTVSRAVSILREMAEAESDVQIKTLAQRLQLPPSTVHRLLELLTHDGMIEHDAAARAYRVGSEFFRLSALVFNRHPIQAVAMPILKQAQQECNETAYLGLYLPQEEKMMFGADCESSHPLGYRVGKNEPLSLLTGASGRSILAYLSKDHVERLLSAEKNDPAVRRAVASRKALHESLAQIRSQGYAITFGQRIPGAVGIFAGVFDMHGRVVGSIGYTIPEQRYRRNLLPQLSGAVRKFSHALSHALGCRQEMTV